MFKMILRNIGRKYNIYKYRHPINSDDTKIALIALFMGMCCLIFTIKFTPENHHYKIMKEIQELNWKKIHVR